MHLHLFKFFFFFIPKWMRSHLQALFGRTLISRGVLDMKWTTGLNVESQCILMDSSFLSDATHLDAAGVLVPCEACVSPHLDFKFKKNKK